MPPKPRKVGRRLKALAQARGDNAETLIERLALALIGAGPEFGRQKARLRKAEREAVPKGVALPGADDAAKLMTWKSARTTARNIVNERASAPHDAFVAVLHHYGVKERMFFVPDDASFCRSLDINPALLAEQLDKPLPNLAVFLRSNLPLGLASSTYVVFRASFTRDSVLQSILTIGGKEDDNTFTLREPNGFSYMGWCFRVASNVVMLGEETGVVEDIKDMIQMMVSVRGDIRNGLQVLTGLIQGTSAQSNIPHASRLLLKAVPEGQVPSPKELDETSPLGGEIKSLLHIPNNPLRLDALLSDEMLAQLQGMNLSM